LPWIISATPKPLFFGFICGRDKFAFKDEIPVRWRNPLDYGFWLAGFRGGKVI